MIVLNKISKKIGTRILFEDVSVAFNIGHRYGLTGPNGAGKSTLLNIMMKEVSPSSGSVSLPKKVGFLRQNVEAFKNYKVLDTVIMGNERLWEAFSERDLLYEKEMNDAIGMRLGELEEIIAEEEGYSADSQAEILLMGMGIASEMLEKCMHEIPTDLQFRTLLCQALFGQPEALLLDEPTNHLDLESIGWLEKFLLSYHGTLIVISHDRHFLNAIATDIADIDYESIITYPGNYDEMVVAKTAIRQRAEEENKSKEKKISQLKEFVSRFGAGTRASQVRSRIKEINRLQPQELKKSNIERPYIRFPLPKQMPGKSILKIEKVSKSYNDTKVIKNLSLEIMKGDKIAVIGNNGRGKTTLLKMLANVLHPDLGSIKQGHLVSLGYFPQNHEDIIDKTSSLSIFDWLRQRQKQAYDQEIRSALGKMLFSGSDAFKGISALSGGETARLIFCFLMLNQNNLLILDEPNNHLDLEAVSALSVGLTDYAGTVVIASHDRDLIGEVATKIIALEGDGIHFFEGTLEEYFKSRDQ